MRIVINANFWPDWHISLKGKASEKYILLGLLGHVDPSFSKLHETWSQPISCKDTLGPRVSLKGPRGVSNKRQFRLGGAFSGWENIWETGAKSWGEKFDLLCWKNISLSSLQHCFGAKGRLFTFYLTLLPVLKGYFLLCQGFMRPCPLEILQAALGNLLFSNQYLSPLSCVHRHCLGHHPFLMAFSLLWYWYCRCYRFEGKVKPLFSWSHNCLYCPHYCPRYCRAPLWQADHVKVAELESNCANIFFSSSPFPSL